MTHHGHHHHWAYIWIPPFVAIIWVATLVAMIATWGASGRPHYVSMSPNQKIAFISDVGADILKPLFVVGACITAVGFFLSLAIERWLRHSGRLLPNMRRRERVMSSLAIFGSLIGGIGLILLSVFDTKRHPKLHRGFLLMFMLGVVLSALFTIIEFRWLDKEFGSNVRKLRIAYISKALIATILIALAVPFGVLLDKKQDTAAVLEWTIAIGFTFYLLTFWYDMRQSRDRRKGELSRERLVRNRNGVGMRTRNGTSRPLGSGTVM